MSEHTDTYALAYVAPKTREWFYIPTVPEARRWRGPYNTRTALANAIAEELGEGATVTLTDVAPSSILVQNATHG